MLRKGSVQLGVGCALIKHQGQIMLPRQKCAVICVEAFAQRHFVMFKRLACVGMSYKTVKGVTEVFPLSICSFTEP